MRSFPLKYTITKYKNCDILNRSYDKKRRLSKKLTEQEVIDLALKHDFPIIIKNGPKSDWLVKGYDYSNRELKPMISENIGKPEHVNKTLIYINNKKRIITDPTFY